MMLSGHQGALGCVRPTWQRPLSVSPAGLGKDCASSERTQVGVWAQPSMLIWEPEGVPDGSWEYEL